MHSLSAPHSTLFLADNLALDFINSQYGVDDQRHDCFSDDPSVLRWLQMAGLSAENADQRPLPGLLAKAVELRACARAAVNAAMSGVAVDVSVINQVFDAGRPVEKLEWAGDTHVFKIVIQPEDDNPASLLWPIANSLVSLLTSDKFAFVRQCEAHDCILLFHDLSKSHRRRWCSMATCGNRMKVAAFRARKKPL
jgi:predicted RNA-binding Zn ribbon-like protein